MSKCLQNSPTVNSDRRIEGLNDANLGFVLSFEWIVLTDSNKSVTIYLYLRIIMTMKTHDK